MRASPALYAAVTACLNALRLTAHRTAQRALLDLVVALLLGQSLRATALARALPSPHPRALRGRYQQVADACTRPWLTAAHATPALVAAALALVRPAGRIVLTVDSVRCGPWELFVVGLVWHGRVLPLSWAVLPYPWPKGQFTPTVCALVRQVAAAWPAGVAAPHLVGDRAFPSAALIATLEAVGWDFTLRLRASDVVTVAAGVCQGYDLIAQAAAPEGFAAQPAHFGRTARAGTRTQVVVGQGIAVWPWHQRDAASQRHRQRRRAHKLAAVKQTRRASPTEPWLVLLTTDPAYWRALDAYGQRYHQEGSFRDAQGGWDGRHGWELDARVQRATTGAEVDAVVGLSAVGTLLQSWVGDQLTAPTTDAAIHRVAASWTVHGRLSVWARGQFAFTDRHGHLDEWLPACLHAAADRIRSGPRPTASDIPLPLAA